MAAQYFLLQLCNSIIIIPPMLRKETSMQWWRFYNR